MFARIVHVADAFDAMTSARAYRGALPVASAVGELWRLIGIDFDAQAVRALAALPIALTEPASTEEVAAADGPSGRALQFPSRPATHSAQHAPLALRKAE